MAALERPAPQEGDLGLARVRRRRLRRRQRELGTTQISDVDQFSGESHRAEVALDRAGLRPVEEVVFIQSDKLTIKDPSSGRPSRT